VHADAICALTNHPQGEKAVREALGEEFAYVDWIRPGFELSKLVGGLGDYAGVVLAHHGLVVWDEDSDRCYQKTLDAVALADKYLDSLNKRPAANFQHQDLPDEELKDLLLKLRGTLGKKQLLRTDTRLAEIASRPDLKKVLALGASSADHMLRIRPKSLLPAGYTSHGNDPRVILVPGVGAVTAATTIKENVMLADIASHTHKVAARVIDVFGDGDTISDAEIFGFDYWPMELFKLKNKPAPAQLDGHIIIVTGAGSGIGRGVALELGKRGAHVVLADIEEKGLLEVEKEFAENKCNPPLLVLGDQSKEADVQATVTKTIKHFGGLDGAVINAGIGISDKLEDLDVEKWRRGLDINLTSAFMLTKEAMKVMRKQKMGGSIVYIASKNAFAPGAGFGGYSVSKAGMLQLMRIAALEGGNAGIRFNGINPDAVFDNSKLWEGGIREQRAAAHGVKPEELEDFYASRNLLNARVRSLDVAHAAAFFLSDESSRTTGSVIAVDGGVAAAFPR
jgi:NAD(P)-dependent dehydrogenase (short-subunit alcohol dehydrogenase family)